MPSRCATNSDFASTWHQRTNGLRAMVERIRTDARETLAAAS
jgi:hypothetical protein